MSEDVVKAIKDRLSLTKKERHKAWHEMPVSVGTIQFLCEVSQAQDEDIVYLLNRVEILSSVIQKALIFAAKEKRSYD
jgi:hypothetical protein